MRVYDAHLEADENGELIFKPVEPLNRELTKRLLNGNELVGVGRAAVHLDGNVGRTSANALIIGNRLDEVLERFLFHFGS